MLEEKRTKDKDKADSELFPTERIGAMSCHDATLLCHDATMLGH
jgi:hypothetical protein